MRGVSPSAMIPAPSPRWTGLDTLRATAILWVMLFHLQTQLPPALEPIAQYGWMGVDLFFVLSGYLIGSQLAKPFALGRKPLLVEFYRRRALRILPAYLAVLLLYCVWPAWREQPGLSPPWQFLTFTLNYFIDYAQNPAFSHAWSLCVEEHFYLLLPLLLFAMMRKASIGRTAFVFAFLVGGGMAIRAFVFFHAVRPAGEIASLVYLERIYYPTHARLDGLLAGVGLALLRVFRPGRWEALSQRGHVTAGTGIVLLGFNLWLARHRFDPDAYTTPWNTLVGSPLLAAAFALLTASAVSRNGWLGRVRVPGARMVALLAFSLYLTHKEMAHLAHVYLPRLTEHRDVRAMALVVISCFLGAGLLYGGIERPCVVLRERIEGRGGAAADQAMHTDPAL